jgi:hypothetical protein
MVSTVRKYRIVSLAVVLAVSLSIPFMVYASPEKAREQQTKNQKRPLNSLMQQRSPRNIDSKTAVTYAPELFYPEETHDFGVTYRGNKLVHFFKFQNTGDAPLRIFKAKGT